MKTCKMMLLLALLVCLPAAGMAQGLEELFTAVYDGVGEGLENGVSMALAAMESELTLDIEAESARIEEGKTLRLTVTAGNPHPKEAQVGFSLALPERLSAAPDAAWQAVLPAAQPDPQTGALVPSVTTFTREITLKPGGGSEQAVIGCEMNMGTRFYRAKKDVALCVPDVQVTASLDGGKDGVLLPGDGYIYRITVKNSGAAPKDVPLELLLPQDVEPAKALPAGFVQKGRVICGSVRAEAAAEAPFAAVIALPVVIAEDALEGDADASRLMSGTLNADGKRVPLPRIRVCSARIGARLTADEDVLEAGGETSLRIMVVNSGLAPADVRVACMLPKGLSVSGGAGMPLPADDGKTEKPAATAGEGTQAGKTGEKGATAGEADATPGEARAVSALQDGSDMQPPAASSAAAGGALVFDLEMEAAEEKNGSVKPNVREIEIRVRADAEQKDEKENLLGAALAWTVDGGETKLGEAAAVRVVGERIMGVSAAEWNCIFWAFVLLAAMMLCLYAATRKNHGDDDYCLE